MNFTQSIESLYKAVLIHFNGIDKKNSLIVLVYADFEDAYTAYIDLRKLVEYETLSVYTHRIDEENALIEIETAKTGTFRFPSLPNNVSGEFPVDGNVKIHFGWIEDGWPIYGEDFLPFDGVIR